MSKVPVCKFCFNKIKDKILLLECLLIWPVSSASADASDDSDSEGTFAKDKSSNYLSQV